MDGVFAGELGDFSGIVQPDGSAWSSIYDPGAKTSVIGLPQLEKMCVERVDLAANIAYLPSSRTFRFGIGTTTSLYRAVLPNDFGPKQGQRGYEVVREDIPALDGQGFIWEMLVCHDSVSDTFSLDALGVVVRCDQKIGEHTWRPMLGNSISSDEVVERRAAKLKKHYQKGASQAPTLLQTEEVGSFFNFSKDEHTADKQAPKLHAQLRWPNYERMVSFLKAGDTSISDRLRNAVRSVIKKKVPPCTSRPAFP